MAVILVFGRCVGSVPLLVVGLVVLVTVLVVILTAMLVFVDVGMMVRRKKGRRYSG